MEAKTEELWVAQDKHSGDRRRLFTTVAAAIDAERALYPGCYVDVAASFAFADVTYVDMDRRAKRFFADADGVREIIEANVAADGNPDAEFRFLHQDYREDLGLAEQSVDLLISLYAGFISEACGHHLRVGGWLLVNPSHGDVAMAAIDPRFELWAAVSSRDGGYRVERGDLDRYLVPKKEQQITVERLHELGRGIAYTTPAFAYLFQRVG